MAAKCLYEKSITKVGSHDAALANVRTQPHSESNADWCGYKDSGHFGDVLRCEYINLLVSSYSTRELIIMALDTYYCREE